MGPTVAAVLRPFSKAVSNQREWTKLRTIFDTKVAPLLLPPSSDRGIMAERSKLCVSIMNLLVRQIEAEDTLHNTHFKDFLLSEGFSFESAVLTLLRGVSEDDNAITAVCRVIDKLCRTGASRDILGGEGVVTCLVTLWKSHVDCAALPSTLARLCCAHVNNVTRAARCGAVSIALHIVTERSLRDTTDVVIGATSLLSVCTICADPERKDDHHFLVPVLLQVATTYLERSTDDASMILLNVIGALANVLECHLKERSGYLITIDNAHDIAHVALRVWAAHEESQPHVSACAKVLLCAISQWPFIAPDVVDDMEAVTTGTFRALSSVAALLRIVHSIKSNPPTSSVRRSRRLRTPRRSIAGLNGTDSESTSTQLEVPASDHDVACDSGNVTQQQREKEVYREVETDDVEEEVEEEEEREDISQVEDELNSGMDVDAVIPDAEASDDDELVYKDTEQDEESQQDDVEEVHVPSRGDEEVEQADSDVDESESVAGQDEVYEEEEDEEEAEVEEEGTDEEDNEEEEDEEEEEEEEEPIQVQSPPKVRRSRRLSTRDSMPSTPRHRYADKVPSPRKTRSATRKAQRPVVLDSKPQRPSFSLADSDDEVQVVSVSVRRPRCPAPAPPPVTLPVEEDEDTRADSDGDCESDGESVAPHAGRDVDFSNIRQLTKSTNSAVQPRQTTGGMEKLFEFMGRDAGLITQQPSDEIERQSHMYTPNRQSTKQLSPSKRRLRSLDELGMQIVEHPNQYQRRFKRV